MPPQAVRLVLVAGLIVGSYVAAHVYLTPPTFGQYGHFRGAALEEAAQNELKYAGTKACAECHDETIAKLAKDRHKTIGCESCHGPSRIHSRNPDAATPKLTSDLCLRCHLYDVARPAKQKQIKQTEHYPAEKCLDCHVAHQPNQSK